MTDRGDLARIEKRLDLLAAELRAIAAALPDLRTPPPPPCDLRELIRQRELRASHFSAEVLGEPAWGMLLATATAQREGRRETTGGLASRSGVPLTTGLRHIASLARAGWLRREADMQDHRRWWVVPTVRTVQAMDAYVAALVPVPPAPPARLELRRRRDGLVLELRA